MSIESILAILAKSTSDNEAEAHSAIGSAYKRMQKEGITIFNLLDRPKSDLYQSSLNRLAERIVAEEHPTDVVKRRETLGKLFFLIGQKFIPDGMKGQGSGFTSSSSQDNSNSRADEAQKAYDEAQRQKQQQQESNNDREKYTSSSDHEKQKQDTSPETHTEYPFWETLKTKPFGALLVPHYDYMKNGLLRDLSYDIKNTFLLFAGAIASGFVLSFFVSIALAFAHAPMLFIKIMGLLVLYVGSTGALNFALWKHKGYSWK